MRLAFARLMGNGTSATRALSRHDQEQLHEVVDRHVHGRWLADLILGAQDGVVNTLGVVLGVAAATTDERVVLASGLAAAIAEAVSMGAVAYTSSMARGDLFRAERAREYRHVAAAPEIEREEIRELYRKKGFTGPGLERVVETICANKDVWVAVMMAEEHQLADVDRTSSLRAAAIVGIASLLGAIGPVLPFAIASRRIAVLVGLVIGTGLLFGLGAVKARVTTGSPARSGAVLAAIGIVSAVVGYGVGALVGSR